MEFWNRASRIRGIRFNGIRAHVPLDGEPCSIAEYEEEMLHSLSPTNNINVSFGFVT